MKALNFYGAIAMLCILVTSCTGASHKDAMLLVSQADSLTSQGDYTLALKLLDSVDNAYTADLEARKEVLEVRRKAQLVESQQVLAQLDSMAPLLEDSIRQAAEPFIAEQNKVYDTPLLMTLPVLSKDRNPMVSYLRAQTDTMGNLIFTSVYYGPKALNHDAIELEAKGETGVAYKTAAVKYDGGLNYRFKDGGLFAELVTYPRKDAVELSDVIEKADTLNKPIQMTYYGSGAQTKVQSFTLSGPRVKALAQTVRLARLYDHRFTLRRMQRTHAIRIERIEAKIDSVAHSRK